MDLKPLQEAAARLMAEHGLTGWTFGLTDAKRRLGVCKYRKKRIEISDYYARNNPEESVLETLLHEIAHALAGPEAGHVRDLELRFTSANQITILFTFVGSGKESVERIDLARKT